MSPPLRHSRTPTGAPWRMAGPDGALRAPMLLPAATFGAALFLGSQWGETPSAAVAASVVVVAIVGRRRLRGDVLRCVLPFVVGLLVRTDARSIELPVGPHRIEGVILRGPRATRPRFGAAGFRVRIELDSVDGSPVHGRIPLHVPETEIGRGDRIRADCVVRTTGATPAVTHTEQLCVLQSGPLAPLDRCRHEIRRS
ncbi:MAG: hypothetical protein KDC38_12360, partial [Planctomycetes bacterium]|nr:hypothetical protein [Planctomycetota bacterium]